MSNAINAMSRGETNRRNFLSCSGKSYYDRFIKDYENVRLKQFTKEGRAKMVQGFVTMQVQDISDPRKAFKAIERYEESKKQEPEIKIDPSRKQLDNRERRNHTTHSSSFGATNLVFSTKSVNRHRN